ncbi:hypothetical protein H8959_018622 [Pygathrix nigripes]
MALKMQRCQCACDLARFLVEIRSRHLSCSQIAAGTSGPWGAKIAEGKAVPGGPLALCVLPLTLTVLFFLFTCV